MIDNTIYKLITSLLGSSDLVEDGVDSGVELSLSTLSLDSPGLLTGSFSVLLSEPARLDMRVSRSSQSLHGGLNSSLLDLHC